MSHGATRRWGFEAKHKQTCSESSLDLVGYREIWQQQLVWGDRYTPQKWGLVRDLGTRWSQFCESVTEKGSLIVFPPGKRAALAVKTGIWEVVPLEAAGSTDQNFCINTVRVVGRQATGGKALKSRRQAVARGGTQRSGARQQR